MAIITTRAAKGMALTHNEVDDNFTNLNNAFSTIFVINTFTLTNQALAATDFGSLGSSNILQETLGRFNKVRLTCRVATASASINTPILYVQYAPDGTAWTTIGSGADLDVIDLSSAGQKETAWIDLPAAAISDNVYFRIAQSGGDGVADPIVRGVCYQFKYA